MKKVSLNRELDDAQIFAIHVFSVDCASNLPNHRTIEIFMELVGFFFVFFFMNIYLEGRQSESVARS